MVNQDKKPAVFEKWGDLRYFYHLQRANLFITSLKRENKIVLMGLTFKY
jgi:hypothetical protein